MEENIFKELTNKTVAIVGNASSIFDKQNGADIDKHDIVIRFNKGFITKPESQGTKTDFVLLACNLTDKEKARYNARYYVNRSKRYKSGNYTLSNVLRAMLKEMIGAQPSTGMMAIYIALFAYAKKIDLYGFDFEKTPTFYNPQGYQTKHNYAKEQEIISKIDKRILSIN